MEDNIDKSPVVETCAIGTNFQLNKGTQHHEKITVNILSVESFHTGYFSPAKAKNPDQ